MDEWIFIQFLPVFIYFCWHLGAESECVYVNGLSRKFSMLCDCLLLYLILGRKFLCSGSDACRLGLRNRQVFFLFMTHAFHCNITWYGYKAKPFTAVRGHLRATSNGGIQSTQIHFPSHGKQNKVSQCLFGNSSLHQGLWDHAGIWCLLSCWILRSPQWLA